MADVTRGGLTVKVLQGRATRLLLEYREAHVEPDGLAKEPYLFAASRNCSLDVMTQIDEFEATQELHGTRGKRTTPKAKYVPVDAETGLDADGRPATHVVGARGRKRLSRPGETATHVRIEPDIDTSAHHDMVHTIYAAGEDLVNPDDPEAMKRFFDMVVDERETLYPGLQESIWLERNGASGLAHVHVASNATLYAGFELGDRQFRAGQKMAGGLTHVHSLRSDVNDFMDAHPEYGFAQALPAVGTKAYWSAQVRSGQKDYWDKTRAERAAEPVRLSRHEQLRQQVWSVLESGKAVDLPSFRAELDDAGVESRLTGVRRGKATKSAGISYRPHGAKGWTAGKTLGDDYSLATLGSQLQRKQAGKELAPRTVAVTHRSAEPAPLPFEQKPLTDQEARELEALRGEISDLAANEQAVQQGTRGQQSAPRSYDDVFRAHEAAIAADDVDADFPLSEPDTAPQSEPEQAPEPFRSGLRAAYFSNARTQRRVAALAQLEEDYEQRGFVVDAEFVARLTDADGVAGMSAGTVGNLAEHLHPAMHDVLTQYVEKSAAAREQWSTHKDLGDELRAMYSSERPWGRASELPKRRDLDARRRAHAEVARQLRDEIAEGNLSLDRDTVARARKEMVRARLEAESTMLGAGGRSLASMKLPGYSQQERPREAELVALVAGEDSKGRVLIDVQLRAEDPLAKEQRGLHLWVSRVGEKQVQVSHVEYSREDVDRMIAAAGDKKVIVAGHRAFAIRGTVEPAVTRAGGRQLRLQAGLAKPLELPTPGQDLLAVQTAHEDRVRATTPSAAQKSRDQTKVERERQAKERSREQDGYDRSM